MNPAETDGSISRRDLLLAMAASAAAATVAGLAGCASSDSAKSIAIAPTTLPLGERKVQYATVRQVEAFPLPDVRLLDGPFLDAQKRDEKYLLSLEPDRMLHNFRVNAGLTPKAPIYGGWESVQTWADIRAHGHTLGHYLSACAMMYASTSDERFKQRCDTIVADLQECQNAGQTGLICAFPDKTAQFDNAVTGRRIVGVPWYTTHKIMAGLRDTYLYCHNAAALEVLVKLSDWTINTTQAMTDAQFQRMLNTEHGGMNEVLADVYVFTGDTKYLKASQRFCHHAVLDPLAQGRDTLDRLHSNTQIPKFIGFQRLHELTGQTEYGSASRYFWKTIVDHRTFATGGNGDNEHFFAPTEFAAHLNSAKTIETCCTYNMLRLTRMLFSHDPAASYADYYERAIYNNILASQDPDSGMFTYFQPTRPGYVKLYCTPVDSFWCCTGTGMENHAKYGDSIYFRSGDALYVNLFIPSQLTWKELGLTLTQKTTFPDAPTTSLKLALERPAKLAMKIRHPAWCQNVTVRVNGKVETVSAAAGSYVTLDRTWQNGDSVEVELPMSLRIVPLPGSSDTFAFAYGPIVLAGLLGKEGITPGADIIVNERTYGDMLNAQVTIPTFKGNPENLLAQIKPASGSPLTFKTQGIGQPNDVTLAPYFRVAHERYTIYFKTAMT